MSDSSQSENEHTALSPEVKSYLVTALEKLSEAFSILNKDGYFVYVNDKAGELLQQSRNALLGKSVWKELPELAGSEFDRQYQRAAADNVPIEFPHFYAPLSVWLEVRVIPVGDALAVHLRDITEQRRRDTFHAEQTSLLEQIAAGAPLQEILDAVVAVTEAQAPQSRCSILLLDKSGRHLKHGSAPNLPPAFLRKIENLEIGPSAGSCGTAAYERRSVIVTDIATDPRWEAYRDVALEQGLRACWSVPIMSSKDQVLGTFAVYPSTSKEPEPAELELLTICSHLVSVAIERHHANQTLLQNERQFREHASLLDKAQDAIIVRKLDNNSIVFWNKSAERLFGWTREEAIGRSIRDLVYDDDAAYREVTDTVLQHGEWSNEITVRRKDGSKITVDGRWTLVRDDDGKPQSILSINTDVTQRKLAEEEIHNLAFYDPLTKLPNRMLLLDRLQHAIAASTRTRQYAALMFIDLDNFKNLNDTLGHDKGDMLLQQVADRLCSHVRETDTVARWGGDEFVIILAELGNDLTEAGAHTEVVAEQLLAAVNQPYDLAGFIHHSSPSIGATLFVGQPPSADTLLKQADLAMYRAKAAGRNTIRFFDPHMQSVINERVTLEADMRHGVQNGEFVLHYQPQVDSAGQLIGIEALMRWRHPRRGIVSPADFIPLAEETGLILKLGEWALHTACRQLVAWGARKETQHLTLALNVSARQFHHPDFVTQVMSALKTSGAPPHNLKFELTESILIDDVEETVDKMHRLKAHGLDFSLDDFGTGYSSLAYLKRLPLGQLKIDQSFVRDVLVDQSDAAIVRTIIALGHSLDLEVIAEGVENHEQRNFLDRGGCHAFQGYMFSRPLPPDQFEGFMRNSWYQ